MTIRDHVTKTDSFRPTIDRLAVTVTTSTPLCHQSVADRIPRLAEYLYDCMRLLGNYIRALNQQ